MSTYGRSYFDEYKEMIEDICSKPTIQDKISKDLVITVNMKVAYKDKLHFYINKDARIESAFKKKCLFGGTIKTPALVTLKYSDIVAGRPILTEGYYTSELLVYPPHAKGYINELYVIGIKEPLRYIYNDYICQLEKHPLFYKINYKEYAYDIAVKLGVLPLVNHQYPHSK